MKGGYSFKQMLLICLGAVLGIFVLLASIYVMELEKNSKRTILAARMETIADMYKDGQDFSSSLPSGQDVRITLLSEDGKVLFDSISDSLKENHSSRPEIRDCKVSGRGWAIRKSDTDKREYCYLAKDYGDSIVRVALPYELDIKHFLRPASFYLIASVLLLLLVLAAIGRAMLKNYRELELALNKVESEKQENRRMKREMTHNIAHELKTPVSSMRGYLEALVDCPDLDEERRKLFIQRAYIQSLRLSDLLRDISIVTKIEEAPELIKVEDLSLKEILDGVLDEFSHKLKEKEMTAVNLLGDDARMQGNYSLIYAIFRNLVENTCKYAGRNTVITVRKEQEENSPMRIIYKDSGRGVPAEMLELIFERFFRLDILGSEDPREEVGSGLGLSVVRNAVNFHGGSISARIPEEGGLEFIWDTKKRG